MERILKLQKVIPPRFRRRLRKLLNELPVRLRDARAELAVDSWRLAGATANGQLSTVNSDVRWLAEVRRVLREGGLLLATTHSPELAYARPDLAGDQRASLTARGFAFAPGPAFNDNSAFHSSDYLRRAWAQWFVLVRHQPYGLAGYQDLTLFEAVKA